MCLEARIHSSKSLSSTIELTWAKRKLPDFEDPSDCAAITGTVSLHGCQISPHQLLSASPSTATDAGWRICKRINDQIYTSVIPRPVR